MLYALFPVVDREGTEKEVKNTKAYLTVQEANR